MSIRIYCVYCKTVDNLMPSPYSKRVNKDGTVRDAAYMCRPCNAARTRRYRVTSKGKLTTQRAIKKYKDSNPKRAKAWGIAQKIKLKPCIICGDTKSQRHHPDIDRPLDVIFLCAYHHRQAEKR